MIGKTLSRRRASSVSSARIEPLEPRRLLAAAMDSPAQFLGEVSAGYHRQIVQNVPARRTDSWGFNITQPVAMTLLADRLKHDGDLILQQTNSKGRVRTVARSNNPGRSAERIELTLEPGRYTITLSNQSTRTNSYRLTARTAEVAAPTGLSVTAWGGNSAHVRWIDNSENETGFRVQQWIRSRWKNVAEAGRNETAAVVSGHLQPGHEPIFRVVARRRELAVASTSTSMVTMGSYDTTGLYKVTDIGSGWTLGERSWTMQNGGLSIQNNNWIPAYSWQHAVWQAVSGTTVVKRTNGPKAGQNLSHSFPGSGSFSVDIASNLHAIKPGQSAIPNDPNLKIITLEDSYNQNTGTAEVDYDYDDFYRAVRVEFIRLDELGLVATDASENTNFAKENEYLYLAVGENDTAMIDLAGVFPTDQTTANHRTHTLWRSTSGHEASPSDGNFSSLSQGLTLRLGTGPTKIDAGFDYNANGQLDAHEVMATVWVDLVRIESLIVSDADFANVTASSGGGTTNLLVGARADGTAPILAQVEGIFSPNALSRILFDVSGQIPNPRSGTLEDPDVIRLETYTNHNTNFTVFAGFDANKNGDLDDEERTHAVAVKVVRLDALAVGTHPGPFAAVNWGKLHYSEAHMPDEPSTDVMLSATRTGGSEGGRLVLWQIEGASSAPNPGDFSGSPTVTLTPHPSNMFKKFVVRAGVDLNHDGVLQHGNYGEHDEVTHEITVLFDAFRILSVDASDPLAAEVKIEIKGTQNVPLIVEGLGQVHSAVVNGTHSFRFSQLDLPEGHSTFRFTADLPGGLTTRELQVQRAPKIVGSAKLAGPIQLADVTIFIEHSIIVQYDRYLYSAAVKPGGRTIRANSIGAIVKSQPPGEWAPDTTMSGWVETFWWSGPQGATTPVVMPRDVNTLPPQSGYFQSAGWSMWQTPIFVEPGVDAHARIIYLRFKGPDGMTFQPLIPFGREASVRLQ